MATYSDQLLGAPASALNGKDLVTSFPTTGVVDVYQETLVGGVDYVIGAFGASNGGTLQDPAVLIFNSQGTLVDGQLDSGVLGGQDPLLFFTPRNLGVGQTETYFIGVFDEAGLGGQYTLSVEGAGEPISFGPLGDVFL